MKKRKTYEISVIDKTYSKTLSDETKFYTSDTALELGFELKETEYNFESAEIVLLNIDDRSLVTRTVAKSLDGFTYELEDDIIAHYGEWRGQLRFEQAGEIYVSSPVKFRIENDLSNDRPPQLSDVQSWVNLKRYADSLVDELKQAVLSIEGVEDTFNENETVRQTTFETSEQERQSAERIRVENENQRNIDHANRSAELAGKADKVVLTNTFENGDFSKGSLNWMTFPAYNNRFEVVEGVARNIETSTDDHRSFIYDNSKVPIGHVTYHAFRYKQTGVTSSRIGILYGYSGVDLQQYYFPTGDDFQVYSGMGVSSGKEIMRLIVSNIIANSDYSLYLDYFMVLDLTDTFGSGNEPTKEEMDELIKITGYIDGEYALNNKEMLTSLMKGISDKANKKQEDWITVPLFNGAQHGKSPLQVMKDEMGFVHFKGSLTNLVSGSSVFNLPVGYYPDIDANVGYIRIPVSLSGGREVNNVQINYIGNGYINNPSNTHIAFFDGVSYLAKRG